MKTQSEGFSVLELFLLLAILTIIASFILRVLYAQEILQWEYKVVSSLGIDLGYYGLGKMAILTLAGLAYVGIRIQKKRSQARGKYQLPRK